MPLIPPHLLRTVFYLYPTLDDAQNGKEIGGTGFFVGIRLQSDPRRVVVYAITNAHCLDDLSTLFLRINLKNGTSGFVEQPRKEWLVHPRGDDLAACQLTFDDRVDFEFVSDELFLSKAPLHGVDIGPGDEVFMVGRFVNHGGRVINLPSVRFGNIAMMPEEPIIKSPGQEQESFLVEMRSLPGYSGSPVFVYVLPEFPRPIYDLHGKITGQAPPSSVYGPWLLGIDWGHLHTYERLRDAMTKKPIPETAVVKSNSGMAAVVPCWKLEELLNCKEFKEARDAEERRVRRQLKKGTA